MRPQFVFNAGPGRLGKQLVLLTAPLSATIAANTTTPQNAGGPLSPAAVEKVGLSSRVWPSDADGDITVIVYKVDRFSQTVALTAAFDIEAATRDGDELYPIPLLPTLTDAQLVFQPGDTFRIVATNNSAAINTQPSDLRFHAEMAVLR
ncbi:MAG TPA: hypothetical protein PKC18_11380 [Lacipirellulaceae bacterium]|nr:hypothetical protein [Lacipirellulaceae bacterium]